MSDVTQVGDIVVRGQRRSPGETGGYGGGGLEGYDDMENIDPGNPESPDWYADPWAIPLTRLDWNLDLKSILREPNVRRRS